MKSKWPGVLIMGALSLALASLLDVLVARHVPVGLPSLWLSWCISLVLTGFVAWRSRSARLTWVLLSPINGGISVAVVIANAILPASASAPYEPGSDWLRSVDFTPPIAARLREAIASGYFAIAMIIAGLAFWAVAYLPWRLWDDSTRHAH